jgi:uncharacterized protein (DUF2147 family)
MLRIAFFLFGALLAAAPVAAQGPTPAGVWLHPNQRIQVEIAPCGDKLCGKMVWFRWPNDAAGLPLVDLKNVNTALRTRPLLGLTIVHGLHRADARTWVGGRIYNPDDGVEYNSVMTMDPDGALRVRAYVVMPLLGKTLVWTRVR